MFKAWNNSADYFMFKGPTLRAHIFTLISFFYSSVKLTLTSKQGEIKALNKIYMSQSNKDRFKRDLYERSVPNYSVSWSPEKPVLLELI